MLWLLQKQAGLAVASDSSVVGVGGRTQLGVGEVTEIALAWESPGSLPTPFSVALVPFGRQGASRARGADGWEGLGSPAPL